MPRLICGHSQTVEQTRARSALALSPSPAQPHNLGEGTALRAFTPGSLRSKETWDTSIEMVRLLLSREPPHSFIMTGCNDTLSVPSGYPHCACGAGIPTEDTNGHSCLPGCRGRRLVAYAQAASDRNTG